MCAYVFFYATFNVSLFNFLLYFGFNFVLLIIFVIYFNLMLLILGVNPKYSSSALTLVLFLVVFLLLFNVILFNVFYSWLDVVLFILFNYFIYRACS